MTEETTEEKLYSEPLFSTSNYVVTICDQGWAHHTGEMYVIMNVNTGVDEHGTYSYPSAIESCLQLQDHMDQVNQRIASMPIEGKAKEVTEH